MKKFLSLVLALIMVLSMFTVGAGAAFEDADEIQYTAAVDVMTKLGILSGYDNNYFSPKGTISRGAAAKILAYIALGTKKAEALTCVEAPFSDVAITSSVAPFITWIAKEEIVVGYDDGTFAPKAAVSGHAYLKMVLGAMGIEGKFEGDGWRLNVTNAAAEAGLFEGVDTTAYDLRESMTRELACQIAFNAMFYSKTASKTQYIVWNNVANTTGAADVAEEMDANDTLMYKGTDAMAAAVAKLGAANGYMIQESVAADSLGYKNFGLKKTENGTTTFKRPAVTYTSDKAPYSTDLKTVAEVKTPVLTYTNGAKAKEIWTALGYTKEADEITLKVAKNGTAATAGTTYTYDKADDDYVVGGKGAIVEVYKTETAKTFDVVVIETFVKKLASGDVVAAKAATDKKDAQAAYIKVENSPTKPTQAGAFKTDAFKKNDVIIYTKDGSTIKTVTKATIVPGVKIEKYVADESITVNGVVLPFSVYMLENAAKGSFSFSASYDLYLDAQGNVIGYEKVTADAIKDYVYVTKVQAATAAGGSNLLTSAGENTAVAEVIFIDGTKKVIELQVKKATSALTGSNGNADVAVGQYYYNRPASAGTALRAVLSSDGTAQPVNNWFAYKLNADGTYTLSKVDEKYAKVADAANTIALEKGVAEAFGTKYTNSKTALTIVDTNYTVKTATGLVKADLANASGTNKVLYTYAENGKVVTGIYAVEQDPAALDTTSVSTEYVYALKQGATVNGGTEWTFAVAGEKVTYVVANSVTAGNVYTLTFDTKGVATAAAVNAYVNDSVAFNEEWTINVVDESFITKAGNTAPAYGNAPAYLSKDIAVTNIEDTDEVAADALAAGDKAVLVFKKDATTNKYMVLAAFITDAK